MSINSRKRRIGSRKRKLLRFARRVTQDVEILAALEATAHLSSLDQKRVLSFAAHVVDWEAVGIIPAAMTIQCVSPEALQVRANSPKSPRRNVRRGISKLGANHRRATIR